MNPNVTISNTIKLFKVSFRVVWDETTLLHQHFTQLQRRTLELRGCFPPVLVPPETLYHRDDALLYIAHVMLIWAAPIPADRWCCSLWP